MWGNVGVALFCMVFPPPTPLLHVQGLTTRFRAEGAEFAVVDGVDLRVDRGEFVGVVGESGCGKSVTALSIMRLLEETEARIEAASLRLGSDDLLSLTERQMCAVRGKRIGMVFQEPMTSLNPVYTVGWQVSEGMRLHEGLSRKQAWERAVQMLKRVGVPEASELAHAYPHQLSGGMRQRVVMAIALACGPELLLADEPTTALDVTLQKQFLELIQSLRAEKNLGVLFISHDLSVIASHADRVYVMYAGQVVESGDATQVFRSPKHPYTRALLASIPGRNAGKRLPTIEGTVPDLRSLPPGCRFAPRCSYREDACTMQEIALRAQGPVDHADHTAQQVRCKRAEGLGP